VTFDVTYLSVQCSQILEMVVTSTCDDFEYVPQLSGIRCMTACEISLMLSNHSMVKLKLKVNYERQSVDQTVLMSGTHLGPVTNFSFSLKFS
jgi:hypothetical protein